MGKVTLIGLGGSLRRGSTSLAALRVVLRASEDAGANVRLFDIREMAIPLYQPDIEPSPRTLEFVDAVGHAQAMVWSSPMYHGSVSGSFKNAIDWLQLLARRDPPYLTDKVVGLMTAAGGTQGLQAVNTMEFIVRSLRAWAVPLVMPVAQAAQAFDENGTLRDDNLANQLANLGREVVRAAKQMTATGACDYMQHPIPVPTLGS
ncbi:NADPH-dependent FMN reductase [Saccharomonospora sp. NPDC046836]|uniref:NADPH-dependent FMN reductase n=1 Tax=Saccharomonospora sp. NPDC046836 TaxID=3156921 RepID=UPI0033FBF00F